MNEIEEAKKKLEEICNLLDVKEKELKTAREENNRLRSKNKDLIAKINEAKEQNRVLKKRQLRGKGKLQDLDIVISRSKSN